MKKSRFKVKHRKMWAVVGVSRNEPLRLVLFSRRSAAEAVEPGERIAPADVWVNLSWQEKP